MGNETILSLRHEGESSTRGQQQRRRRRPLHASFSLLLIASSSSSLSLTSAASNDGTNNSIKTTNLRHNNKNSNNTKTTRKLKSKNVCPPGYNGKAPTSSCSGYVSCSDGAQTGSPQPCAAGTKYDINSKTCTWPDKVDCKVGDELIGIVATSDSNGEEGEGEEEEEKKFCPERYTGRAPTTNCKGYVQCNRGKEGISANCPPRTKFSTMTNLCEYNLDICEMLVGESIDPSLNVGVNSLDTFCPDSFTGRAPTEECKGYVDCKDGVARRSKMCPSNTKFDAMILACTYSATGCDVVMESEPTMSPLTQMEARHSTRFQGCEGEEYTNWSGYLPEPGCEAYLYCQMGREVNRFECAPGTLYNGQYCTWADSVSCDDTKVPTVSPTEMPTPSPSDMPTYTPTELDLGDVEFIYYPKFSDGTCRNDGNFPENVGHQYLYNSADRCCSAYFESNMEACLRASVPSPSPTPDGLKEWFPDYDNGVCLNDDSYSEFETNFFWTYDDCCRFDWIPDTIKCLRNRPTVAYYPDYERDACKSDGRQSPFEMNLFDSMEDCCRFKWIDYGLCINGGRDVDEIDAGGDGNDLGIDYYPDQDHNVCNCDGKQSLYEVNIYSSYEDCCDFSLIDTNICLQYKMYMQDTCVVQQVQEQSGNNDVDATWYPDERNGLCRNDGMEPRSAELTTSYQTCCKKFFPGTKSECRTNSEAAMNAGGGNWLNNGNQCTGLRPRQCNSNNACEYNIGLDKCVTKTGVSQPSPTPAYSKSCSDLSTKRSCKSAPSCMWNMENGPCMSVSSPVNSQLNAYCDNLPKKVCVRGSRCAWQKPSGPCLPANNEIGSGTIPAPSPSVASTAYNGNVYYADYMNNICLNDGQQKRGDDTFETVVDCCRDPWVEFKTCILHARKAGTVPGADDGGNANTSKNDGIKQNDAPLQSNSHPYYPDYFYNVCRNDGNQSPMEVNLFGKLKDCCGVQYIDYDSCMSNAKR